MTQPARLTTVQRDVIADEIGRILAAKVREFEGRAAILLAEMRQAHAEERLVAARQIGDLEKRLAAAEARLAAASPRLVA